MSIVSIVYVLASAVHCDLMQALAQLLVATTSISASNTSPGTDESWNDSALI